MLVFNAQGPYGPPGSLPFLPRDQAMATVAVPANGRYVAVSGDHITMIYGLGGARQIVEAITAFLQEGHDPIAR